MSVYQTLHLTYPTVDRIRHTLQVQVYLFNGHVRHCKNSSQLICLKINYLTFEHYKSSSCSKIQSCVLLLFDNEKPQFHYSHVKCEMDRKCTQKQSSLSCFVDKSSYQGQNSVFQIAQSSCLFAFQQQNYTITQNYM